MSEFSQKTIESFFQEYNVADGDKKAKLLPLLTDVIYDYNMRVVDHEKATDEYRRKQISEEIGEIEEKIKKIFTENNI